MSDQHPSRLKLLDASLRVMRTKGYNATRVEDLCEAAGVTKGSFFHHFESKQAVGIAAAEHWQATVTELFANAPYHQHLDPLDRVLAYVEFRKQLLFGPLPEVSCFAGTLVQELYASEPAIRDACERSISSHVTTVEADLVAAIQQRGLEPEWTAESLALHMQAVIQGALLLAKAKGNTKVAADCLDHLKRYIELSFTAAAARQSKAARPRGRPHQKERNRK